jgi:hypothetical protein
LAASPCRYGISKVWQSAQRSYSLIALCWVAT